MKDLDLLPKSFHESMLRRRLNRRNGIFSLAIAVALAGLHLGNRSRLQWAEASLEQLEIGQTAYVQQEAVLRAMESQKGALQARAALISRLDDNAPLDVVLAEIVRLMTPQMTIRSLELKVQPPEGNKAGGTADTPGKTWVTLRGLASSDVNVGVFVGKLSASEVFDDVSLRYSREADSSAAFGREFELAFAIERIAIR